MLRFSLAFLLLAGAVHAQTNTYFAVRFQGENTNGYPVFWPVETRALGTNQGPVNAGETLMNWAAVRQCIETNRAAFQSAEAEKTSAQNANIARLVALYNQIPTARTWSASTLTTCTNIESSLVSGTNTTPQVVARIRQINAEVATQARINAGVLELLQRLGPVLRTMYQAENDDTK